MIFGVFSCTPDKSASFLSYLPAGHKSADVSLFRMTTEGFDGGVMLNKRLPYSSSELCYSGPDLTVLISGTIYNREELSISRQGDTSYPLPELVAELFRRDGPGFVSLLNGDFAICIVLPEIRQLWLFRDQVGIRPICWSVKNGSLLFSSELNDLSRFLASGEKINSEYLTGYFRHSDLSSTPCSTVNRLMPGHWLKFDTRGVEINKYWFPEKVGCNNGLTYDLMIRDLDRLLKDAVRIRCDSRFTAAAHVSGGLDSGVIAALTRKEYYYQEPFYGFSLSPTDDNFTDLKYDERQLVTKLGEEAGIIPVFSDLNLGDFIRLVGDYFLNVGFFADDRLLEQASALNVNLIFSGWGGDEFISTGSRSIEADLLREMKPGLFFRRHPVRRPRQMLKVLLKAVLFPSLGIIDSDLARSLKEDARYLRSRYKKSNRRAIKDFYMHSSRRRHHLGMLNHYHLQERCEAWSINGWYKGIEYRYPLLDRRIIEYLISVPSELLCRDGFTRPILRTIGEGIVPDEIRLKRSKVDPVYRDFIEQMYVDAGCNFIGEIELWRSNRDLGFIDFDLLEEDFNLWKKDSSAFDGRQLFRVVVYIKAFYELSGIYHQRA